MLLDFVRNDGSLICRADVIAAADTAHGQPTIIELTPSEAAHLGEPRVQLLEGCTYEYQLDEPDFTIATFPGVLRRSKIAVNGRDRGMITTSLYVGTLRLDIFDNAGRQLGYAKVEVRSKKIDYRSEYREMLSSIAEWAADLVASIAAPSSGRLGLETGIDNKTLQQRFFLIKALLSGRNFDLAISRIKSAPHSHLASVDSERDIRRGIKPTAKAQREVASKQQRIALSHGQWATSSALTSLPARVSYSRKEITYDTPENRFVKYVLVSCRQYLLDISFIYQANSKQSALDAIFIAQIARLIEDLDLALTSAPLKHCARITNLNIGSVVLQNRAGYRELLRIWLMLQMTACLSWSGGEMVFEGGRKNVATLYEYWCFVMVFNAVSAVVEFPPSLKANFIRTSRGGLELTLTRGLETSIVGTVTIDGTVLAVELSFNQTFAGGAGAASGSWTREMRPDITLAIWPGEFEKVEATAFGFINFIHFDAKYKSLITSMVSDVDFEEDELTYTRDDLSKMHAYRDAIRRSEGAYILYPGSVSAEFSKFQEILPGLGALPLRPGDSSTSLRLTSIITEFFSNCASQSTHRAALSYAEERLSKSGPIDSYGVPFPKIAAKDVGGWEVLDPRNRFVAILKASISAVIDTHGTATVSVRLEDFGEDVLSRGLLGQLVFMAIKNSPRALMRVTRVIKSWDSEGMPWVHLHCGPVANVSLDLKNSLDDLANTQSAAIVFREL